MTLTWALLALGLALVPGGARAALPDGRSPGRAPVGSSPRPALSPRAVLWCGGVATAIGCVAVAGVGRGLVLAVVFVPALIAILARVQARPPRARAVASLALALDLVAVALGAGQPLSAALALAAPAAEGTSGVLLSRAGRLLQLGADPVEAWREAAADPVLAPIAAAARRSAISGARLAATFERLAVDVRAQRQVAGQARAQRAGVLTAAPLGLCFLPAFVCLGVVPIVIGVAGAALSGVR